MKLVVSWWSLVDPLSSWYRGMMELVVPWWSPQWCGESLVELGVGAMSAQSAWFVDLCQQFLQVGGSLPMVYKFNCLHRKNNIMFY